MLFTKKENENKKVMTIEKFQMIVFWITLTIAVFFSAFLFFFAV